MKIIKFSKMVYDLVAVIPYGRVTTYGFIALMLGYPKNSRQVGQILCNTPPFLNLPCHRVVNHSGRLAPNFTEQRLLLEHEGVSFKASGNVDFKIAPPWIRKQTAQ